MRAIKFILSFILILVITICSPFTAIAQACGGYWVTNRPFTFQCISGQIIGQIPPTGDPIGCPINPAYSSLQTNTFLFDSPVSDFFIDFNAFDAIVIGCPRMQVKINGIFFQISDSNLTELPIGTICSGSVSYLAITNDGYITSAEGSSNGQGRLVFSGVNASSITISTNDRAGGIVVSNPCFEPLPIQIKSLNGFSTAYCNVTLQFESGIESNVRNIEIEGSFDGVVFSKLLEMPPKGSDSKYIVKVNSAGRNFYRLKINDLDGSFSYSKIIHVSNPCNSLSIRISPNPSTQKILVENVQANDQLIIVDVTGRQIYREQVKNSSTEIKVHKLVSGIYFIKLFRRDAKLETLKFLKQ